jgi:hypothetical protein
MEDVLTTALLPAFMIRQLKTFFQMGFALFTFFDHRYGRSAFFFDGDDDAFR